MGSPKRYESKKEDLVDVSGYRDWGGLWGTPEETPEEDEEEAVSSMSCNQGAWRSQDSQRERTQA